MVAEHINMFVQDCDLFNCAFVDQVPSGDLHRLQNEDRPFTGLDARVLEENILRAVLTKALGTLEDLRQLKIKFKLALVS
jgi:hypothetical protein